MWNDFIMPMLVMRAQKLYSIGVGLMSLNSGCNRQWGPLMAAYCIDSSDAYLHLHNESIR